MTYRDKIADEIWGMFKIFCHYDFKERNMHARSIVQYKIKKVMEEMEAGKLHSGGKRGPKVTSRKQALAIAYSEAKKAKG